MVCSSKQLQFSQFHLVCFILEDRIDQKAPLALSVSPSGTLSSTGSFSQLRFLRKSLAQSLQFQISTSGFAGDVPVVNTSTMISSKAAQAQPPSLKPSSTAFLANGTNGQRARRAAIRQVEVAKTSAQGACPVR